MPAAHTVATAATPALPGAVGLERCPRLVRVAGHPVFVAPELSINCFYADGGYWLLPADAVWRCSAAFDGPWRRVDAEQVPLALLRLPLGAYRAAPALLAGGEPFRPPRWDLLWGPDWAHRHPGWARRDPHDHERAVARPPWQQAEELRRSPARRPALPTDFHTTEERT